MNLNRNLIIAAATFAGTLSRVALGSYTFTPVSDPSAVAGDGGTNAAGFYDGTIVGDYGDATGHHGFVFNGSSFTNFDDPSVIPASRASSPTPQSPSQAGRRGSSSPHW
jgi:hypothetical protein